MQIVLTRSALNATGHVDAGCNRQRVLSPFCQLLVESHLEKVEGHVYAVLI